MRRALPDGSHGNNSGRGFVESLSRAFLTLQSNRLPLHQTSSIPFPAYTFADVCMKAPRGGHFSPFLQMKALQLSREFLRSEFCGSIGHVCTPTVERWEACDCLFRKERAGHFASGCWRFLLRPAQRFMSGANLKDRCKGLIRRTLEI